MNRLNVEMVGLALGVFFSVRLVHRRDLKKGLAPSHDPAVGV